MSEELRDITRDLVYRTLIENTKEIPYIMDLDGGLTYVGPQVRRYGIEPEDLLGQGVWNHIHPDDADRIREEIRRTITLDEEIPTEFRILDKDGGVHWVSESGTRPYRDDTGKVLGVCGLLYDITERKKAEDLVRLFQSAIEASSDAVGMSTAEGEHYYQNHAFDELFGDIGSDPAKTVYVDEKVGREVFATIMGGAPWNGEVQMFDRDGNVRHILLRAYPIKDESARVLALVGIHTDITDRIQAEEALADEQEKLTKITGSAQDAVVMMDNDGNISFWNEAAETIFGYAPEEAMGRELHILLGPQQFHDAYRRGFAHYRKTGEGPVVGRTLELQALRKNGEEFPIELSLSAARIRDQWHAVGIIRDITDRKKAEARFRQSEARYRLLFERSRDAIMTLAPPSWRFTSGNPATIKMFGARDEPDFISRAPWEYSPPRQPDGQPSDKKAREMIETAMREGSHFFDWQHMRLDGRDFPATVLLTRFELQGEIMLQATVRDITERKRAEEAIRESEAKLHSLVDNIPDIVMIVERDGTITSINRTVSGYTVEETIGTRVWNYIPSEYHDVVKERIEDVFRTGEPARYEIRGAGPDGTTVWYETHIGPIKSGGEVVATTHLCTETTERKELAKQLNEAQEDERHRISEQLHDDIGQLLTAAKMRTDRLRDRRPDEKDKVSNELAEISRLLSTMLGKTRDLSRQLSPLLLDELGLASSLRSLAAQFEETSGITVFLECPEDAECLSKKTEMIIYRVAQEALTNIAKHAGAREIKMALKLQGNYVELMITDDGQGFDVQEADRRTDCLGIRSMRQRLTDSGGFLYITSQPSKGTSLRAIMPPAE